MKNFILEWAAISAGLFIAFHILILIMISVVSFIIFSSAPIMGAVDKYDWLTFRVLFSLFVLLGFLFSIVED